MSPNTTLVVQSMDHMISALKKRHIIRYLDKVLVVLQEEGGAEDTWAKNTRQYQGLQYSFWSLYCAYS